MRALYAYSLLPVLALALLLFFTTALRTRGSRGLAAYCLSVAVWCATLLAVFSDDTAAWAERLVAVGAFIVAGYLHVAYDVIGARDRRLVVFAYAVAVVVTTVSALLPGVVYNPVTLEAGALFWPTMALGIVSQAFPSFELIRAYQRADPARRPLVRRLATAGIACAIGGLTNAALLAHGHPVPIGMFLVLVSLIVLSDVVREHEHPAERRLIERTFGWALVAAVLSAGLLGGLVHALTGAPVTLPVLFALAMAALAIEPLKQWVQEAIARRLGRGAGAAQVARALEDSQGRAEHAERLAELGTVVSAVAHEVRNPLGVLAAHVKLLEATGTDRELLDPMRAQIDRAAQFVEDLLRYGRPRPLELRALDLGALVELSASSARASLGASARAAVEVEAPDTPIEADQAQLGQVVINLVENALLSARGRVKVVVSGRDPARIVVDDDGPGVAPEIVGRLFVPFVSGRKREGPRPGTGLGLATARGIVERHGGRIWAERAPELGGARFVVELPARPELAPERSALGRAS